MTGSIDRCSVSGGFLYVEADAPRLVAFAKVVRIWIPVEHYLFVNSSCWPTNAAISVIAQSGSERSNGSVSVTPRTRTNKIMLLKNTRIGSCFGSLRKYR